MTTDHTGFVPVGGVCSNTLTSQRKSRRSFCHRTLLRTSISSQRCGQLRSVNSARPVIMTASASVAETATDAERVDPQALSENTAGLKTVMDMREIMKILPHRYPFLLLDKVVEVVPGKSATGVKNVTMNEPYFQGHFPDRPIMPGVLQVEALAQLGGIVMLQPPISDGKGDFFFGGVDNVRWRKPVLPGDTLVMQMILNQYKPRFGIAKMSGK